MKPLLLIMNAFGSFASRTEIDFTLAPPEGVFLISGRTGSGKTTIFDAITYALYGKASGSSRLSENFRSKNAAPTEICSVTLEFLLNGLRYSIKRTPTQRFVAPSGKIRELKHSAELTLPDGKKIDALSAVNETLLSLLGISCDQFRRIVMLPQGEFKALLEAPSNDKKALFRQLFDTADFDRFTKLLEADKKALEQGYSQSIAAITTLTGNLAANGVSAITEHASPAFLPYAEISRMTDEYLSGRNALRDSLISQIEAAAKERAELNLPAAEALENQFAHREQLCARLNSLLEKKDEFSQKEARLELIAHAQKLAPFEDAFNRSAKLLANTLSEMEENKQALSEASATLASAKKGQQGNKGRLKRISEIAGEFSELCVKQNLLNKYDAQLSKLELQTLNTEKQNKLLISATCRIERARHLLKAKELEKNVGLCDQLLVAIDEAIHLKKLYYSNKDIYLAEQNEYFHSQAALLAQSLQDDTPCPVCGSLKHPKPAEIMGNVLTEAQLEQMKKELDECFSNLQICDNRCRSLFSRLAETEKSLSFPEKDVYRHYNDIYHLRETLQAGIHQHINSAKWCISEIIEYAPDLAAADLDGDDIETLTALRQNIELALSSSKASQKEYSERLEELSLQLGNTRDMSALRNSLKALSSEKESLETQNLHWDKQLLEASERFSSLEGFANSLSQRLEKEKAENKRAKKVFDEALSLSPISSCEQLNELRKLTVNYPLLSEEVKNYREELLTVSAQKDALDAQLSGRKRPMLAEVRERCEKLSVQESELREQLSAVVSNISLCLNQLELLKAETEQSEARMEKLKSVNALFMLANGDNDKKISFETFILSAYFEDIIHFANLHLFKMTDGRYQLSRMRDKAKYNAASGLDLEVMDADNSELRPVTTLSGGESFKASLALSLGLADVIQHYSGAIRIETLFIDEGFGNLDEESVESAVDTLLSLSKQGTLVGVISHVESLRRRIPCVLNVSKDRSGSHAVFNT